MGLQPQYKDYNELTVTLCEDYVMSNINTRGLLAQDCHTHISSVTIVSPQLMDGDTSSFGTTGTVEVFDYSSDVFYRLMKFNNAEKSADSEKEVNTPFAPITIEIKCYTGNYSYHGAVSNWSFSFTGSVPTITLEWVAYQLAPTKKQQQDLKLEPNRLYGNFKSVSKFIDNAQTVLSPIFKEDKSNMPKIVYDNNGKFIENLKELDNYLMFPLKEDEVFNISSDLMGNTDNWLLNCYKVVADYAVSKVAKVKDKDGKDTEYKSPVVGEIIDCKDNKFIIKPKFASSISYQTEESKITDQLIFVQNGAYPAYQEVNIGSQKRVIIPVTSFNFKLDFSNTNLVNDIWFNLNGSRNTSKNSSIVNGNLQQTTAQESDASNSDIEFECWNVMSFVCGNTGSKIRFAVFDENGNEHPLTANDKGYATVMEVSYEISGAVVKAKVKATKNFNTSSTTVTDNIDSNKIWTVATENAENAETSGNAEAPE